MLRKCNYFCVVCRNQLGLILTSEAIDCFIIKAATCMKVWGIAGKRFSLSSPIEFMTSFIIEVFFYIFIYSKKSFFLHTQRNPSLWIQASAVETKANSSSHVVTFRSSNTLTCSLVVINYTICLLSTKICFMSFFFRRHYEDKSRNIFSFFLCDHQKCQTHTLNHFRNFHTHLRIINFIFFFIIMLLLQYRNTSSHV